MKIGYLAGILTAVCSFSPLSICQTPVVLHAPETDPPITRIGSADEALIRKYALPKVRAKLAGDTCEEAFEVSGVVEGAFTIPGAKQRAVFYQFCQTGNGLGEIGLIIINAGKVVGNFTADVGWTAGIKALPDIDQNGLDEIALYYSGGIHQGAGGIGVDIVEVSGGNVRGIGWFQAESFDEAKPTVGYLVTAKPGSPPVFFREKRVQSAAGKWRTAGRRIPFKPEKAVGVYKTVK